MRKNKLHFARESYWAITLCERKRNDRIVGGMGNKEVGTQIHSDSCWHPETELVDEVQYKGRLNQTVNGLSCVNWKESVGLEK